MKNWKQTAFVTMVGASLFATTAGAAGSSLSNQVTGQSNITPKAVSSTPAVSKNINVKKIDLSGQIIENTDWLSDSKILVVKENTNLWAIEPQYKSKYHPSNLYVRDLGTGKDTLLVANKTGVSHAIVSPDKKYIFFIDDNGYNIMNVNTTKTVNVLANVNSKSTDYASWSDNTHFVYWNSAGDIISVDVNGKSQILLKTGQKRLGLPRVVGSTIYYAPTAADNSVTHMSYNMQTKESTTFKNVNMLIPSPNGSQLAVLNKDNELVLTDLKGNVKSAIAQGEKEDQIFMSWSPDGSKLAYSISSQKGGAPTQTQYVYEVKTGKKSQVLTDKNIYMLSIKWSSSGQKILYVSVYPDKTFIASLS